MAMPEQKRGRSKQDYGTPKDFLTACCRRFGISSFDWDLAAHEKNHIVDSYLGPGSPTATDALTFDWLNLKGDLWLNPPFDNIKPWAERCARMTRAPSMDRRDIYFLTPASIGSNWFAEHVYPHAFVYALQGRLSFDGIAPYPKDCMLSVFSSSPRRFRTGFDVWDWRKA